MPPSLTLMEQAGEDLFKFMDELKKKSHLRRPHNQKLGTNGWNHWKKPARRILKIYCYCLSRQTFSQTKCFKRPAKLERYAIRCVSCATTYVLSVIVIIYNMQKTLSIKEKK